MPQSPQSSRIRASKDGLQTLKNARESKRTNDGKRWSYEFIALKLSEKSYHVSKDTVERFLTGERVYRDNASAICEFLGFKLEDVIESVTSKSKVKSTDIDWQEVCFTMLKPKRELASNLFTSGMGIKFELDDIHVPLGLVERPQKVQRRDDASPEEGSRVYREEKEKITPIDYDDFFQQVLANQQSPKSNGKRLNIIGEPGAGKTTQLLKIADWVLDETEGLPIWISLGVVREKPLQEYLLKDWLRDAAGKLDAAPPEWVEQLEQHLKNGRVWLLLDGADEMQVTDPLGKLAEFVRVPLLKNVRVVLTCRLNLWDATVNALSEFDTYKMLDFSYGDGKNSDQVKQFIDKWFGNPSLQEAYPCVIGTEGGQQLRKALDETGKERIKDLARNPLRLALLCFTWQSGRGKLPDTKAELYELLVAALYVLKKGVFPTTSAQQRDLNTAFGRLALKAIDKGFKSILPQSLVDEELKKPHPELFELAGELGWLNPVGAEPENPLIKSVYAFFHPTFQEYFAACAISEEENWNFFMNYQKRIYRIFEPQWREVILLWLGRDQMQVPDEQKEQFIQSLIEFDDECGDFYKFRAYFLAAAGIAEFGNCTKAHDIVAQVAEWAFGNFKDEKYKWQTLSDPIPERARVALRETERGRAIAELLKLIRPDEEYLVTCESLELLGEIGIGNSQAIKNLEKLIELADTKFSMIYVQATEALLKINPNNAIGFKNLLELINQTEHETLRKKAIEVLGRVGTAQEEFISVLEKIVAQPNEDIDLLVQAANSLGKIDPNNFKVVPALVKFINLSEDEINLRQSCENFKKAGFGDYFNSLYLGLNQPNIYEDARSKAFERLEKIALYNSEVIPALVQVINSIEDEDIRSQAIAILGRIGRDNSEAITTLKKLIEPTNSENIRRIAAESLGKIAPNHSIAMAELVKLTESGKDENIRWLAARSLGEIGKDNCQAIAALKQFISREVKITHVLIAESLWKIDPENPIIIQTLEKLIEPAKDERTRRLAAESLGRIALNHPKAIAELVKIIKSTEGKAMRRRACDSLNKILREEDRMIEVVAALKEYLSNEKRYRECYQVIWHCAQNMSYPKFCQAQDGTKIQVIQVQNIDCNQLQPTGYTYPLAINLLSLKGETDKEEIAQEICIQIYKHPDVDISGEPPDTFNARQLKKRLFPIKDKLQRQNLALVLYIQDTNGFHEPTEEAIALSQKLADPNLGIHIAWITNQSIEQPLKDIQPDPPKLISRIQSWIDEIV